MRAQVLRQFERAQRLLARRRIDPLLRRRIDEHRMPGQIGLRGQARRAAHHRLAAFARADAGQQRIARGPYRLAQRAALGRAAPVLHLRVHPVGRAAQRQLAQRDQIALAKEIGRRLLRLLRDIDLARGQPRQQLIGRQIHHHLLLGGVEQGVGHRLPDAHAGDAADHVVQALQVLHVHRAPDVDAGGQQLLHILPALGVARARGVAVRQLVEQHQRRLGLGTTCTTRVRGAKGQRRVQVELLEHAIAVGHLLERQQRQTGQQRLGLGAAMGFHQADDQRCSPAPAPRGRR